MKKYYSLIYQGNLSKSGAPMLKLHSIPVLDQLETEINLILLNVEYLKEIILSLKGVLSGKDNGYSFGHEVYYFECDKEECDVYEWDKKIGLLRTQDFYDMLKYFQDYRDNYYASRQQ